MLICIWLMWSVYPLSCLRAQNNPFRGYLCLQCFIFSRPGYQGSRAQKKNTNKSNCSSMCGSALTLCQLHLFTLPPGVGVWTSSSLDAVYALPLDSLRTPTIAEKVKMSLNNCNAIRIMRFDDCNLQVIKLSLSFIFV